MAGDKGFGSVARRWLKAKADELLTTDRRTGEHADREEREAEREVRDKATQEAVYTAVPGLRDMVERSEQQRSQRDAEREAKRVAELRARPPAQVSLRLSDDLVGSWSGTLPARVEVVDRTEDEDEDEEEGATGPRRGRTDLVVELQPVPGEAPLVSGLPFVLWTFTIPGWHGPGTYDLAAIWRDLDLDWDGTEWTFDLEGDESYHWWSEEAESTVEAGGEGGRELRLRLGMQSAGGHIVVDAEVVLPAFVPTPG